MTINACLYTELVANDLRELDEEDVGIRAARSNLTEFVARVRLLKQVKFLTNRNRRVVAVVPMEYYERAERAFAVLAEHPQLLARVDSKP